MNKHYEDTIATAEEASLCLLRLDCADMPETNSTTIMDFDKVKHLCSEIPIRFIRPHRLLSDAASSLNEDHKLATMAMRQAKEAFDEIWCDPADNIWDDM